MPKTFAVVRTVFWVYVARPTRANLASSLALHALHAMACALLPGSIQPMKILDASWGVLMDLIAWALYLVSYLVQRISPTAILNDLLFKIAVRSNRLSILVSGLLDACVTAFNLRRTRWGLGVNFRELLCGRFQIMTAVNVLEF